jgi:small subunit ribosomal protein S3
MGQKVNPHGLRVGVIKDWDSRWYAGKSSFGNTLVEDYNIRKYFENKTFKSDKSQTPIRPGISNVEIERDATKVKVIIHTAKPGMLIGPKGAEIDRMRKDLEKITSGKPVNLNIVEVRDVDLTAQLVAENIASQLEQRVSFRRAMKQVIGRTMKAGAMGIKTMVSGRLGGAEIARSENYHEGTIPLQTLRADIDYGTARADTTYGVIGVKVWIYKGEVLKGEIGARRNVAAPTDRDRPRRRRPSGDRNEHGERRDSRPADGNRPAGQGGYGNRPAGQSGYGNRPAGQGGYGNRPAGQGGYGNRPAGQGGYGNRPAGQGGYGNRPAGQGGYNRPAGDGRPAGDARPAQSRPAGDNRPAGDARPAGGNRQTGDKGGNA